MTESIVFDTQALLIFYLNENEGAKQVEGMLREILDNRTKGYINIINLTEMYYILSRKSKQIAEEKERNLRSYGVRVIPVKDNDGLWKEVALLKAGYSLSLADAFAAVTAKTLKAKLVTGKDSEFDGIKGVERIRV